MEYLLVRYALLQHLLIYGNLKLATLFATATIITLTIAGFSGAIIPVIIYKLC